MNTTAVFLAMGIIRWVQRQQEAHADVTWRLPYLVCVTPTCHREGPKSYFEQQPTNVRAHLRMRVNTGCGVEPACDHLLHLSQPGSHEPTASRHVTRNHIQPGALQSLSGALLGMSSAGVAFVRVCTWQGYALRRAMLHD